MTKATKFLWVVLSAGWLVTIVLTIAASMAKPFSGFGAAAFLFSLAMVVSTIIIVIATWEELRE